jgi:hypothetical protein
MQQAMKTLEHDGERIGVPRLQSVHHFFVAELLQVAVGGYGHPLLFDRQGSCPE